MMASEHILQTERDTLKFRLLGALVVAAAIFLQQKEIPAFPLSMLVVAYLVYSFVLHYLILRRFRILYVVYGMIVCDAGATTIALGLLGLDSAVFMFFPLLIIYYAVYLGYVGSIMAATIFSLCYVGLAFYLRQEVAAGPLMAFRIPLLYLIALFTGYLAWQRLKEREEKLALQEIIRAETGAKSLLDMAKTLNRSLDLGVVLSDIARLSSQLTGLPGCIIFLLAEERRTLVARAANIELEHLGVKDIKELTEPLAEGSLASLAIGADQPIALTSGAKLPAWFERLPFASVLVTPLTSTAGALGVIYLLDTERRRSFNSTQMQLARGVSELASMAIRNAQLFTETEQRTDQLLGELKNTVQRMGRIRELKSKATLSLGPLTIEPSKSRVSVAGKPVRLSPTEFEVLYFLAERPGTAINQDTMMREVWGENHTGRGNVVDVCIHRLRRKLQVDPSAANLIRTVKGSGYMLTDGRGKA